jgi:hypothetical protein
MTDQNLHDNEITNYQTHLKELINKSQEAFEKQLVYISAGSFTVSLAFIKDVVGDLTKTSNEGYLITAWCLMGITLLINLLSHIFTSNFHNSTIAEIGEGKYDYYKAIKRFQRIKNMNYFSIISLILGFIALVVFISINI